VELACDYSSKELKEEEGEAEETQTLEPGMPDYTNDISQTRRYSTRTVQPSQADYFAFSLQRRMASADMEILDEVFFPVKAHL
jgi:hypothetical protein